MQKQQGMSLFGMLSTVIIVIILAVITLRVVPVYIDNYNVRESIKSLKSLSPATFTSEPETNATILKSKLIAQLEINGVKDYKPEQIIISLNGSGNFIVSLKYTVIRPLVYNVSLMFDFDESEEISIGPK